MPHGVARAAATLRRPTAAYHFWEFDFYLPGRPPLSRCRQVLNQVAGNESSRHGLLAADRRHDRGFSRFGFGRPRLGLKCAYAFHRQYGRHYAFLDNSHRKCVRRERSSGAAGTIHFACRCLDAFPNMPVLLKMHGARLTYADMDYQLSLKT